MHLPEQKASHFHQPGFGGNRTDVNVIYTQADLEWEAVNKKVHNINNIAINAMPPEKLQEDFTDEKYSSYFRNLLGITEHIHYHLGQIVLIKKMIREGIG